MKKIFSDKRFKYGTYSTVITIVVIILLVLVNLVVGEFDKSFDLTADKEFALSEETKQVLDEVNEPITLYTTFQTSNNDSVIGRVSQIIEQYRQSCSDISVENMDLYLHPDFAKKYSTESKSLTNNSIVIESGDKYRVINYSDYYDESTGKLNVESSITSAIRFVNEEASPTVYFVTGHDEFDPSYATTLTDQLGLANYTVDTVNLLNAPIPADCATLVITPVSRDYSEEEATRVTDYLANDGRALVLLGGIDTTACPNLLSIISAYGYTLEEGYIFEGDESNYMTYPYAILPEMSDNDINTQLTGRGYRVLTMASQALKTTDLKKKGIEVNKLLTTSRKAFIKSADSTVAAKESGDKSGPFDIAVSVEDKSYTDKAHSTKLIIMSASAYFISPQTDSMVNNANSTFAVNAINWLNDSEDSFYVPAKNITADQIVVDAASATQIKTICFAVLPGIIFVIGFVVWLIRRNM
jgi:hypothetical protein